MRIHKAFGSSPTVEASHAGQRSLPGESSNWKTTLDGIRRLGEAHRLVSSGRILKYKRFVDDFPVVPLATIGWTLRLAVLQATPEVYVVQTVTRVIERCMLMTTDPGDLVLDPTCGSGTTAFVAEKWGRRWITCDTSRVAVTLAKQRLMTASFDYYELKYPHEGLKGGFIYKTVPHVTLKSIANNPEIDEIHETASPCGHARAGDSESGATGRAAISRSPWRMERARVRRSSSRSHRARRSICPQARKLQQARCSSGRCRSTSRAKWPAVGTRRIRRVPRGAPAHAAADGRFDRGTRRPGSALRPAARIQGQAPHHRPILGRGGALPVRLRARRSAHT